MKRSKKIILAILTIPVLLFIYSLIIILDANAETDSIVYKIEKSGKIKLRLNQLSQRQKMILLKVQDPAFYSHSGIDLCTPGAGLTTITQSLVKWLYFKNFKPGLAKIKQSLIAFFVLDKKLSKNKQLELFINLCGLGRSKKGYVYGFADAARIHFNKPFSKITEDQFISLVAMLIAPRTFHAINQKKINQERVRRIKKLINGQYKPKGLMDLYYGKLDKPLQTNVAPFSYFDHLYK